MHLTILVVINVDTRCKEVWVTTIKMNYIALHCARLVFHFFLSLSFSRWCSSTLKGSSNDALDQCMLLAQRALPDLGSITSRWEGRPDTRESRKSSLCQTLACLHSMKWQGTWLFLPQDGILIHHSVASMVLSSYHHRSLILPLRRG